MLDDLDLDLDFGDSPSTAVQPSSKQGKSVKRTKLHAKKVVIAEDWPEWRKLRAKGASLTGQHWKDWYHYINSRCVWLNYPKGGRIPITARKGFSLECVFKYLTIMANYGKQKNKKGETTCVLSDMIYGGRLIEHYCFSHTKTMGGIFNVPSTRIDSFYQYPPLVPFFGFCVPTLWRRGRTKTINYSRAIRTRITIKEENKEALNAYEFKWDEQLGGKLTPEALHISFELMLLNGYMNTKKHKEKVEIMLAQMY